MTNGAGGTRMPIPPFVDPAFLRKDDVMAVHHDREPASGARRHHVHVYTAIRIAVAVSADDHRSAMEAADRLLFDGGLPVRLVPTDGCIESAGHAEEVFGYLVDEAGGDEHRRSRSYGPDRRPDPR